MVSGGDSVPGRIKVARVGQKRGRRVAQHQCAEREERMQLVKVAAQANISILGVLLGRVSHEQCLKWIGQQVDSHD